MPQQQPMNYPSHQVPNFPNTSQPPTISQTDNLHPSPHPPVPTSPASQSPAYASPGPPSNKLPDRPPSRPPSRLSHCSGDLGSAGQPQSNGLPSDSKDELSDAASLTSNQKQVWHGVKLCHSLHFTLTVYMAKVGSVSR